MAALQCTTTNFHPCGTSWKLPEPPNDLRVRLHDTATAPLSWTASLPWRKMGTEPNGHGTPSTAPTPSTATAPSCVNGLIGSNVTYFDGAVAVDGADAVAVSCKRCLT